MSTIEYILTDNDWLEIGSGPLNAETKYGENAYLHFADSKPSILETAFHDMFGPASYSYTKTQKCYARAVQGEVKIVVT